MTTSTSCASQYSNNYDYLIGIGYNDETAGAYAFAIFWDCLENTYGPLPDSDKNTKEATPKQTESLSPR